MALFFNVSEICHFHSECSVSNEQMSCRWWCVCFAVLFCSVRNQSCVCVCISSSFEIISSLFSIHCRWHGMVWPIFESRLITTHTYRCQRNIILPFYRILFFPLWFTFIFHFGGLGIIRCREKQTSKEKKIVTAPNEQWFQTTVSAGKKETKTEKNKKK